MKTITIIVNPAGETQLQTQGFQGSSCLAASRALEKALGLAIQDQKTAEFYQNAGIERFEQAQAKG